MLTRRRSRLLCVLLLSAPGAPRSVALAQTTVEASVSTNGDEGDDDSRRPSLSADGRFVAFESVATNLDPADSNGVQDVFWRDLVTSETRLVSRKSDGTIGNKASGRPRISADGAFVVFESDASNLVSGDTNAVTDIFLHEIATGVTTRLSVSSSGLQGNRPSQHAAISGDGSIVVFASVATNLVSSDRNGKRDVFLRDVAAATTVRISVTPGGAGGDDDSDFPAISADGGLVVFWSDATNLVSGDLNARGDVFLHDVAAGTTRIASLAPDGSQADSDCLDPAISPDGRFVAFQSFASNLSPPDGNNKHDVFVVELSTGAVDCVSVDSAGNPSDGDSFLPQLSGDGRFVAFGSHAQNLIAGGANGYENVFVHDRSLRLTSWISLGDQNQTGSGNSVDAAIADDGSLVAFGSDVPGLVPADHDGSFDVFVRERDLTAASWSNYGSGLAGTHGAPALVPSAPPVLNTTIDLQIGDSASWFTVGLLLVGASQADLPAWGGHVLVEPLLLLPVAIYPGTTLLPESVPPDELLAGDEIDLQVIELDAGAIRGVSMTPGLALTLGF